MEYSDPLIRELQTLSGIPEEGMKLLFEMGSSLSISASTILNAPTVLANKSYYFTKGVIREYYVDKEGNEHTMRFLQAPNFITPSWTEEIIQSKTIITSQALTNLEGISWTVQDTQALALQFPQFHNLSLNRLVQALHIKNIKEIRRHQCSASERYRYLLEEFPGLVNQVSLKHIASYLNMTPETLSRVRADISNNPSAHRRA